MLCSRSRENGACSLLPRTLAVAGSAALVAAAVAADPDAPGFHVRDASTRLVGGTYLLDADIELDFSAQAVEAMENGVAVTVLLDLEVIEDRWWWWDRRVHRHERGLRIARHALSDQYVVRDLDSGDRRTFASFADMAGRLGRIDDLPVIGRDRLAADEDYRGRLRARLDIEALPSPLRPLAYVSEDWRLTSDWYEWPIER